MFPTESPTRCSARYQRPGGFEPGDRVVRCHLQAGHPGDHEEADTEVTWSHHKLDDLASDLPEGQQSKGSSSPEGVHVETWEIVEDGRSSKRQVTVFTPEALAARDARVRADEADEIAKAITRTCNCSGCQRGAEIAREHAVAPAESVVGAPPDDLAAPDPRWANETLQFAVTRIRMLCGDGKVEDGAEFAAQLVLSGLVRRGLLRPPAGALPDQAGTREHPEARDAN